MAFFQDQFNRGNETPLAAPYTNFVDHLDLIGNRLRAGTLGAEGIAGGTFTTAGNTFFARATAITFTGASLSRLSLNLLEGSGNGYQFAVARNADGVTEFASRISRLTGFVGTALVTENVTTWISGDALVVVHQGSNLDLFQMPSAAPTIKLLSAADATYSGPFGDSIGIWANGALADL